MKNAGTIFIKNTLIVDGTGKKPFYGSISIEDGQIKEIIEENQEITVASKSEIADLIIDGTGLVTSPGFIDVHSHNDLVPFMSESIQSLKLFQGVTTELVGQCGLGAAPCSETINPGWKNYIRGVVGDSVNSLEFPDFQSYISVASSKGLANNYAALISHGAIRTSVMSFEGRSATEIEVEEMSKILEIAMNAGAFGLSLGLQYMPGIFSGKDELVSLCKIVAQNDGIVMVHLRNHDITILEALDEMIDIAKLSEVRLHISHLRSYASETLGCRGKILCERVNSARSKGIDLTFDQHVYLSGSTLLTQLLPPWITSGGAAKMIERLNNPLLVEKLRSELENPTIHYAGWDNYSYMTGFENILITSVHLESNKEYIGQTIGEIAIALGIAPFDFFVRLLKVEGSGVGIVTLNVFSEEDLEVLLKHSHAMIGSDSIPAGRPHPRLFGNYPLFIGKFVREKKLLTLEEAIRKATSLPAETLGLKNRGILAKGMAADIVLFDFAKIDGYQDYHNPTKAPKGIQHVIVNGIPALLNGKVSSRKSGTYLKKAVI